MNKATKKTQKRYNRYSGIYDFLEIIIEKRFFKNVREETLKSLDGRILEIGVGTGKNLMHYGSNSEVTGIDISPGMLKKARVKVKKLGLKAKLEKMDAQNLDFEDNKFDYVVGSFVLCSIPDPVKALKEIKRVLKKNGKAIFIEHVLSKYKLIALWENLHNPITSRVFGFNVNRKTKENIHKSGFIITNDEKLAFFDVFRRFTCSPGGIK